MQELKNIIESLLFVAKDPLTVDQFRNILETADGKTIRKTLEELATEYEIRAGGFALYMVAGGWQLRSRPEYHEWIKKYLQPSPQRLSKAALETLTIIAYKQPIIRADIEHIRGVDCGGVLRQLMERKLIRVLGRKEIPGRPLIYATTKNFLQLFDLKDLKDLPTPMEIETLDEKNNQNKAPDLSTQTTDKDNPTIETETETETENSSVFNTKFNTKPAIEADSKTGKISESNDILDAACDEHLTLNIAEPLPSQPHNESINPVHKTTNGEGEIHTNTPSADAETPQRNKSYDSSDPIESF